MNKELYNLDEIDELYDILFEEFGVDFTDYKIGTIKRRIEKRISLNSISTLKDYILFIKRDEKELKELFKDLIIIVTSFFRDKESFLRLEEIYNVPRKSDQKADIS